MAAGVLADQGECRAGDRLASRRGRAPNPWAKAVLPAPRSPASSTMSPGTHRPASAPASARVPSTSVVRQRTARGPAVRSRRPAERAAWPGSGRPASRPPPRRPTAARRPGGRSAPGGPRRTGTTVPGPIGCRRSVSRSSFMAKLPRVTTTVGSMSSIWAVRYGRQVAISIGPRVAVVGRPALDHVGDVAGAAVDAELLGHQPVEQLARSAHEGLALEVLVPPRRLAHEHQLGLWSPTPKTTWVRCSDKGHRVQVDASRARSANAVGSATGRIVPPPGCGPFGRG